MKEQSLVIPQKLALPRFGGRLPRFHFDFRHRQKVANGHPVRTHRHRRPPNQRSGFTPWQMTGPATNLSRNAD